MFGDTPTAFFASPARSTAGSLDTAEQDLERLVRDVISEEQVQLVTPEALGFPASMTTEGSPDMIERADMVIADVSGARPNVMLEVGIAQALRKPLLVLSRDRDGTLPFDVKSLRIIHYRPDDLTKLSYFMRDWVNEQRRSVSKLRGL